MNSPSRPLLGVRVLLVEDDEDTRELFAFALEEAGAEVRAASDAKDAMRIILQWRPFVVVSDLSMPATDGLTLLREVRSLHQFQQIPAIAVSGLSSEKIRADALAAGFQEVITKPLDPDRLIATVGEWVSEERRRRDVQGWGGGEKD